MMRRGFSLFELLIAIGLSSFIMLGLIQGYRNAVRLLQSARNQLVINRRVALLFNQMERDITAGVVYVKPVAYQKPAPKRGEKQEPQTRTTGKKEPEQAVRSFVLNKMDDAMYKHRGIKREMTKSMNLLCTTPLEVFGSEHERMVRVGYELALDKKRSANNDGPVSYTLYRKQTHELKNEQFKQKDDAASPISKHIVAEKVRRFSMQATYLPKPDTAGKKESASTEQVEPVKTFEWQDKEQKKSSTGLPETISIHLVLWDDEYAKEHSFECLVPCLIRDATTVPKGSAQSQKDDTKSSPEEAANASAA